MKLWILGGQGLLGCALQQTCTSKQIDYVATGSDVNVSEKSQLRKFLRSKEGEGVTHLINCAALADVDRCQREPELAFRVNAIGPGNVGEVAARVKLKVVHISSDYVFGGQGSRPYLETDPCAPMGVYAQTKWEGEKNLIDACPSACIVRSSWLFGKGGKNFISSILQKIQKEEVIRVVSDQRGRPTFAPDLAEAILSLLCHSGIFHFANHGEVSRFQMAEKILHHARQIELPFACRELIPVESTFFQAAAPRPQYCVLNTEKAAGVLGAHPRSWEEAFKEYIAHAI